MRATAVLATLVSEREYQRDTHGRFGSGGSSAGKPDGEIKDKGAAAKAAPAQKPGEPTTKYRGYGGFHGAANYILQQHGQAIFRKAGQKAGRQAESVRATLTSLLREAVSGSSLAQIQREGVVRATLVSSGLRRVRATIAPIRATLADAVDPHPQMVRAEVIDPGADHTDRVPAKSFVDDLDRKLKLKSVMGKKDDPEKKKKMPKDVAGAFKQQSEDEEKDLPSEGMQFEKEEVNYRYASDPGRACSECVHFNGNDCEIVAGLIRRVDTCDKFHEEQGQTRAVLVHLGEPRNKRIRAFKRTPRGKFSVFAHSRDARRAGVQIAQTVEGGPGSGRHAELSAHAEKAGAKFNGIQHTPKGKKYAVITDHKTKSTTYVPMKHATPEGFAAAVQQVRQRYGTTSEGKKTLKRAIVRATLAENEGEMGDMNSRSTIKGIGG